LSSPSHKIVLNCPVGRYPKSFPVHAHDDFSSFVWIYKQIPVLIDVGRNRYTKDGISILQKSAGGHSVSLVNGFAPLCESLVISGNWWPRPYAKALIEVDCQSLDRILLAHNGFHRATPVKKHQREIILGDDQIIVRDCFAGLGKVHINNRWQFSKDFDFFESDHLHISSDKLTIAVVMAGTTLPLSVKFDPVSWASDQYGTCCPSPLLSIEWQVDLPFQVFTYFRVTQCAA
jgi:hypothetical protein